MFFPSLLGGGGVIGGWEKFPSFTVFFILTASLKHLDLFLCIKTNPICIGIKQHH
jgi:hypothetical protein